MLARQKEISDLERWLIRNNMTINELAEMVGCNRQTIRRIKQGDGVESRVANQVYFITSGAVNPQVKEKGSGIRKQLPQPT